MNKEQSKRKKMSGVQLEKSKLQRGKELPNRSDGNTKRFIHIFICMCIPILQYTQFFHSFEKECQTSSGGHNF